MNPHGDVPIESEADWQREVVQPARQGFENVGVPVEDLTDDQVLEASQRILEDFGGDVPDLTEIAKVVDAIRFEGQLVEGVDDGPRSPAGRVDNVPTSPSTPSAPRSADCPTCIPHKMNYPSGWYVVHSAFCPTHPKVGGNYVKIRPVGVRSTARQTQRLLSEHANENYRSGVVNLSRDPYRDADGRDVDLGELS